MVEAANTPGCDTVGLHAAYSLQLAFLKLLGEFGLQNVVGSRRAAANVPIRDFKKGEARIVQELARLVYDPLAMLQGARRMIRDANVAPSNGRVESLLSREFADVLCQRRDILRLLGVGRVSCEKMSVVLHGRAAPDVLMMIASSGPPFSRSAYQTSIFCFAKALALASFPICKVSAPQQPSPSESVTS